MSNQQIPSVLYTTEGSESQEQTKRDLQKPDPDKATFDKLLTNAQDRKDK